MRLRVLAYLCSHTLKWAFNIEETLNLGEAQQIREERFPSSKRWADLLSNVTYIKVGITNVLSSYVCLAAVAAEYCTEKF